MGLLKVLGNLGQDLESTQIEAILCGNDGAIGRALDLICAVVGKSILCQNRRFPHLLAQIWTFPNQVSHQRIASSLREKDAAVPASVLVSIRLIVQLVSAFEVLADQSYDRLAIAFTSFTDCMIANMRISI